MCEPIAVAAPASSSVRGNLDSDRVRLIVFLAGQGRSLREIGAEVNVSHETVRSVLRQAVAEATRG